MGRVVHAFENINDQRYLIWSHSAIEGPLLENTSSIVVRALIDEVERLRNTYKLNQ